jgi:hypothetical protein
MAKSGVIKEALAHSLDSIFRDHYAIPDFQRPYIWKRKNIIQLFNDAHQAYAERGRDEYFIGSIVVYRGRDGRLNLVDGQQRVVTLILLNCAFRDRILDLNPTADTKFFDGLVRGDRRTARGRSREEDRVYAQTFPDREILSALINRQGEEIDPWHYPGGQRWLVYSYQYLLDKVSSSFGTEAKEIRAFAGFVAHNLNAVRIETDTFQSALQIFETINERGVNLAAMDLVKNYLFSLVTQSQRTQLKDAWSTIAEHLDVATDGSRQSTNSTRFLRYFVMSQFDIQKDRVVQANGIYEWIRQNAIRDAKKDPTAVLRFVREMEKNARAFANISSGLYPGKRKRQAHLEAISLTGLRIRQHAPLLMAARQHSDPVIDQLASAVERMIVVFTLAGAQWNEIETVIPLWCRKIRAANSQASMKRFIETELNPKVAEHLPVAIVNLRQLGKLGDSIQRYVLARLTQYVEDEAGQGGKLDRFFDTNAVTIEHILAQNASGVALDPFSKISQDELPDQVYALGNLCLLFRVPNSMVGARPYAEKAPVYKKYGQFLLTRAVASSIGAGKNTKYSRMEQRLKHFSKWNPKSVQDRTKNLERLASDLWKLTS